MGIGGEVRPSSGKPGEKTGLGWLQKTPLVSLLFAVAIATVPFLLGDPAPGDRACFDDAREAARDYFVRNPALEVDALGELVLDTNWLVEARAAAEAGVDSSDEVLLPPRLLARSQARLDGLVDDAYLARRVADPSWRLGVLALQTPGRNYVAHAFVHELGAAVALCVIVLLLAGIPLERAWGSPVFALFVLTAIPLTAQADRVLDGSSGVPWSGSAGLTGALVGAYFIRSLGGHFPLSGWMLLPAWIAADALVVRGFWIDDPGAVPWATLAAAVALGAGTAGALRLLRVEARVDAIPSSRSSGGPNPAVARAARMRSDGDPYQAFELIQAAWSEGRSDFDPVLTGTDAYLALADPSIEGSLSEEVERLVATKAPAPSPAASPEPPLESHSQLDRRVQAEHQTVEATVFPLELDTDVDPRDDETDTDFTPVIDAMLSASSSENVAFASPAGETPTKILTLRSLKAVDAVPVGASDEWVEIDAEGRGKSKLPLHRVEAIAIGAVDGLGLRPVLVLDLVLNCSGDRSEPLKSIRLRSDRFDPLAFSPGGPNPLEALTSWIAALESATGATCLPTRDVLAGRFGRFPDLAAYERDVLMAEASA